MNRQEFFRRLEYLLRGIPEYERMDALAYYNAYFDDAGVENEQQVLQELGSPEQVAQMILDDYYGNRQEYSEEQPVNDKTTIVEKIKGTNNSTKILLIILLLFTFPLWIGIVAGLFGAVVGVLGGLFGVTVGVGGSGIGILVGGMVCIVMGIFRLFSSPVEGIVTIGVGALLTAISVLLILLFALLTFRWVPALVRTIVAWGKRFVNRQRGGSEI